jgi:hypothetical protein
MKILLQHRRKKLFFRRLGVWTSDPHAAFDFEHTARAIEFAHAQDLTEVQLLVKFSDSECDEVVPIPELFPEKRQLGLFWDCGSDDIAPLSEQAGVLA